MGQYCDSKELERNWFFWLLSSSAPALEIYREHGLLWTRVRQKTQRKKQTLPDPLSPMRAHCIALGRPIYLNSYNGTPQSKGTIFTSAGPEVIQLPGDEELTLFSDSPLHRLDMPFIQRDSVIPTLKQKGYVKEPTTESSWHAMLVDINKICIGIAMRFKQPTEEEQLELANEALLQVTKKLVAYKLVYTPGRAPVFNLLTTTIYRCMYSIMNRRKAQRQGLQKFVSEVNAGMVPRYGSARTPIGHY